MGEVKDVRSEILSTRIAVVPVFSGNGRRIKILEAWAHEFPIVSTPLGCARLDAGDGENLLIASDGPAFVEACTRLIRDDLPWGQLSRAGLDAWRRKCSWSDIARDIERVLQAGLASGLA